jgi:hypothetical protein
MSSLETFLLSLLEADIEPESPPVASMTLVYICSACSRSQPCTDSNLSLFSISYTEDPEDDIESLQKREQIATDDR